VLALGRRSRWPVARSVCATYIELVRGVPLISVLFMASFMLPLLLPPGLQLDVMLRVLVGITLFTAAYLAEVVRGGLQAVPAGQLLAARALGLGTWQVQRYIVLPQALRATVPALVNSFIGTFKDTSLVAIVSLYELTGGLMLALGGDPTWRPFYLEGYLFIGAVYWVFCFAMSRYSRWIEGRLRARPEAAMPD
jgi:general L-amino acid transport system permease protein